ncbi:MAG TPA: DnaJ domain-containing protein [Verrucomicrobiota bacterium]|jgi:hypothetical protein|nr:MAG: Chaperone protein DnaJ [Verrucomicrobia bacterium ADurb.Bin118]HPY31126.1 DnaJ domain-containing protein [Verrucomicrobiota bacterium]HQB17556.1 DnaJ domain-containing protein [Verrucomicrobiota bacterium]
MPLPDYYQILGVSSSATIEEIKKAYRKLARENHPDLGGSHERMLAINEAFFVLANAEARAAYDQSRRAQASEETRRRAAQNSAKAARAAEDYPRDYQEFEDWVDRIAKDFANARYGSTKGEGWKWPTVKNSVSGVLFLVIGACLGGYLGWKLMPEAFQGGIRAYGLFATVFGGAWVGQFLHACVKATLVGNQPAYATGAAGAGGGEPQRLVVCPKCKQKLRADMSRVGRQLRCPRCRTEFTMR